MATTDRITARYARNHYGQRVRIIFRDGTEDTGILLSWGPRVIRYNAPGWHEISTVTVRDVFLAPAEPAMTFRANDMIRFTANGVTGIVTTNHGPAENTETGNDVITWRVLHQHADGGSHLGDECVHDASLLELAR